MDALKYSYCLTKHNPPHSYGDCVRACIASLLSIDTAEVPHFFDNDASGEQGAFSMRHWLAGRGLALLHVGFDGSLTLRQVLDGWADMNPDAPAMLMAGAGAGDHAVIVLGDKIEHNPAWYGGKITGPNSNGYWNFYGIVAK